MITNSWIKWLRCSDWTTMLRRLFKGPVSIVNTTNPEQDQLCANMIGEVVKLAAERVNNKSRTASVVSSKIDEVGLLQSFLSR